MLPVVWSQTGFPNRGMLYLWKYVGEGGVEEEGGGVPRFVDLVTKHG